MTSSNAASGVRSPTSGSGRACGFIPTGNPPAISSGVSLIGLRSHLSELSFSRELSDSFFDCSRVVHRAELRTAHSAELRALEVLGRQGLVVIFLRAIGIERKTELFFPVERVACT